MRPFLSGENDLEIGVKRNGGKRPSEREDTEGVLTCSKDEGSVSSYTQWQAMK